MYMDKRRGPKPWLSQRQMDEIFFLSSTGCPCCGDPLKNATLGLAYGCSRSTISRIRNSTYRVNTMKLDLREHVKLVKEVRVLAEQARAAGANFGS